MKSLVASPSRLLRSRTWPAVASLAAADTNLVHSQMELAAALGDERERRRHEKPDLLKACTRMEVPGHLLLDARKWSTLARHYYPEGGWGWVVVLCAVLVSILAHGLQLASGQLTSPAAAKFGVDHLGHLGWLGALSTAVSLLISPVTASFCRRKSTRVTGVLGGLLAALGCLFTSFATQFHQLFFSYVLLFGIGVGMARDSSTLMVGQYFKRRRTLVEIFIVAASGVGLALMSAFVNGAISAVGWRLGLQAVTGAMFTTFFLGTFYRSASLYHPQRRAIVHLKNQKRKIKDKNKVDDRPPFFDFSTLRSKTVRILLASTALTAFGLSTPIFYLAPQTHREGISSSALLLHTYLGLAWALGCGTFGLLVARSSAECHVTRHYLCQAAAFTCGIAVLALTAVQGDGGYVLFVWVYGVFCGGYHYSLKMFTYQRVRARNFARTWSFVQCSQAVPIALGVPIAGYISTWCGGKSGYYFSSACVLLGTAVLSLLDVHRRQVSEHVHTAAGGVQHTCHERTCTGNRSRLLSFADDIPDDPALPDKPAATAAAAVSAAAAILGHRSLHTLASLPEINMNTLTCISEEKMADELLDETYYPEDCISSCDRVENHLMLSELENNMEVNNRRRCSHQSRDMVTAPRSDVMCGKVTRQDTRQMISDDNTTPCTVMIVQPPDCEARQSGPSDKIRHF